MTQPKEVTKDEAIECLQKIYSQCFTLTDVHLIHIYIRQLERCLEQLEHELKSSRSICQAEYADKISYKTKLEQAEREKEEYFRRGWADRNSYCTSSCNSDFEITPTSQDEDFQDFKNKTQKGQP